MIRQTPPDATDIRAKDIPYAYIQGERLIRIQECLSMTGEARTTCHENIAAGLHPVPFKDGRTSVWLLSEMKTYLEQKVARMSRKV